MSAFYSISRQKSEKKLQTIVEDKINFIYLI